MLQRFRHSPFFKNVATLISGTTLAQAIPFLISPIIARLYLPEEIGVLALFVSVLAILATLSTGRYEKAIILPPKPSVGKHLTVLSQYLVLIFSLIVLLVLLIAGKPLLSLFKADSLMKYYWLIVLGVLVLASDQIYYHWANRLGKYKTMSLSKIGNNVVGGGLQLLFGVFNFQALGLLLAKLSGILTSFFINFSSFPLSSFQETTMKDVQSAATRYEKFPKYLSFAHVLNSVSINGVPIALAFYFNESEIGLFAMTQRVIMLPISIVSRAVGDVFREKATKDFNKTGSCRKIYGQTLLGLMGVVIIPFMVLLFFAPAIFSWFFGPEWTISGEYAQILSFLLLFQFVVSPVTNMFMIAEKQSVELVWQILFFASSILSIIIGALYLDSMYEILIAFTIARACVYLLAVILTYRMTERH